MEVTVKLNGGLFHRNVPRVLRAAMYEESLEKIALRMERGGKGLGARRNTVKHKKVNDTELRVDSTRIYPRVIGSSWQRKNIGIAKSMAPRVLRKGAQRVVEALS
jgi:hypothetical protein